MKTPLENCNTVTSVTNSIFLKEVTKTFENRNGNVVSLYRDREKRALSPLPPSQAPQSLARPSRRLRSAEEQECPTALPPRGRAY